MPDVVHVLPKHKHALVAKYLNCLVAAKGQEIMAARIAEEKAPAFKVLPKIFERAAVGAMPLGATDPFGFANEVFIALLVDNLRALLGRFTRVPPRLKIPLENASGGNAAWVGQGLASPVLKSTTATATLDIFQIVAPSVLTRELFRFSVDAENTFMRLIGADVSRFLAAALFDSSKTATSANPSSVTAFASRITSTGSTAAQMIADLNNLITYVTTAMVDPAWVMRPSTFYHVAATLGGVGLNVTRDNLLGIPVTLLSGMPREIVLVDCASVFYASDDQAELSLSTETTVEMSDAPSQSGISGSGAQMVSLFQSGLVGVNATLTVNWASPYQVGGSPASPSGVSYMLTSY